MQATGGLQYFWPSTGVAVEINRLKAMEWTGVELSDGTYAKVGVTVVALKASATQNYGKGAGVGTASHSSHWRFVASLA
jgi:hypothetical protein